MHANYLVKGVAKVLSRLEEMLLKRWGMSLTSKKNQVKIRTIN